MLHVEAMDHKRGQGIARTTMLQGFFFQPFTIGHVTESKWGVLALQLVLQLGMSGETGPLVPNPAQTELERGVGLV